MPDPPGPSLGQVIYRLGRTCCFCQKEKCSHRQSQDWRERLQRVQTQKEVGVLADGGVRRTGLAGGQRRAGGDGVSLLKLQKHLKGPDNTNPSTCSASSVVGTSPRGVLLSVNKTPECSAAG